VQYHDARIAAIYDQANPLGGVPNSISRLRDYNDPVSSI
jgi:hypothetical protein